MPCIIAPDTDKNPPTITAANALGILTSLIMLLSRVLSFTNMLLIIVLKSIDFVPIYRDIPIPIASKIKLIKINRKVFTFLLFKAIFYLLNFHNIFIY